MNYLIFFFALHICAETDVPNLLSVIDSDINRSESSLGIKVRIISKSYDQTWERISSELHLCCSIRLELSDSANSRGCRRIGDTLSDSVPSIDFYFVGVPEHSTTVYIHSWIQLFADGGVISGSSSYMILDRSIPLWNTLSYQLVASMVDRVPLNTTDESCNPRSLVLTHTTSSFQHWNLQTAQSALCTTHSLSDRKCFDILTQIMRHVLTRIEASVRASRLPTIMHSAPSSSRPFVFIHIEKCAGTFLRM